MAGTARALSRKAEGRPAAAFIEPGRAGRDLFLPAFDTAGGMAAVASTLGFSFLGFLASLLERN
jgi:hypothetical protein